MSYYTNLVIKPITKYLQKYVYLAVELLKQVSIYINSLCNNMIKYKHTWTMIKLVKIATNKKNWNSTSFVLW